MAWHDLTCRLTAWLTLYCCIAFAPNSGGELFEQKKRENCKDLVLGFS
jgi:hypothetical protein